MKKELPLIGIISLPFIYLAYYWNELPAKVPVHWNIKGEIDRYGDKSELLLIPFLLPLMVYLIFLLIPIIDPKKNLNKMGKKYNSIKFLLTTFMSVLAIYIIHIAKSGGTNDPNALLLLLGVLFLILGNYFKTIKANYFIGIRTPWTLESEEVWKSTHRLAGRLWFFGGIAIVLLSLLLEHEANFIAFISITIFITLIPVIFSYLEFRKREKNN